MKRLGSSKVLLERDLPAYMHFTFTSALFGFVDDVEFLFDEGKKTIHFRSASRVGHSDIGANRKRMNIIKKDTAEALSRPASVSK
jgi:uncharacterized protein (DUF1499 family)